MRPRGTRSRSAVRPDGGGPAAFETAQRRLFEAVGLEPDSRFVSTSFGQLHVLDNGPTGSEPPLVFVHGTAAFGAFLAPLLAQFDDVRVLTFDRPGYGLSDDHRYDAASITRTVVTALVDVLDALNVDQINLVGHSMGGHTAVRFTLEHPERVRRLSLIGAVVGVPGTSPMLPIRLLTVPGLGRVLRSRQQPGEDAVLDIAEIFGEREAIKKHPALIQAIAAHESDPERAAAGVSEFGAVTSLFGWRSPIRLRVEALRAIQPPTTVLWGDGDPLGGPEAVREGMEEIPDVRFESVEAGHFPFLRHAERCAEQIREQ